MISETTAHEFVVIGGDLFVALIHERNERSISADLFRNLDDLKAGRAMERGVRLEV